MNNLSNYGYLKFQPNWANFRNGKKVQHGLLLDLYMIKKIILPKLLNKFDELIESLFKNI
jgi:hypothetical protein